MAELTFHTDGLPDVPKAVCLRLGGIIDVTTADTFRATLLTLLSVGYRHLLLDFAQVQFINSTGFASMVEVSQTLSKSGGTILLSQMRPEVRDICVDLGLDAFFTLTDSEAGGLSALREIATNDAARSGELNEFHIGSFQGDPSDEPSSAILGSDERELPADIAPVPPAVPPADTLGGADASTGREGLDEWGLESKTEPEPGPYDSSQDFQIPGAAEIAAPPRQRPPSLPRRPDPTDDDPTGWTGYSESYRTAELDGDDDGDASDSPAQQVIEPASDRPSAGTRASESDVTVLPRSRNNETTIRRTPEDMIATASGADRDTSRDSGRLVTELPGRRPTGRISSSRNPAYLKAVAGLLQAIPEEHRIWCRLHVYMNAQPANDSAALTIVVATSPGDKPVKDSFPLHRRNPHVTLRPVIQGTAAKPRRLIVDATARRNEHAIILTRDEIPEAPTSEAAESGPHIEVWYGSTMIRTVKTPPPFA